jgi:NAD(P)-dependent dehydrogenase (short-subunit alcohol dehydrogenase family)
VRRWPPRSKTGGQVTTPARRPEAQDDADAIIAAATAAYGAVDSVFVASGYNKPALIEAMPYEDWQAIMDANVRGPWLMAKAFGQHLASRDSPGQSGRGKLLLVSSVRGRHGSPAGYSAYSTSKGATDSLTKTLATEWARAGSTSTRSLPWCSGRPDRGSSPTPRRAGLPGRNYARISLKRLGEPEDSSGSCSTRSAASDFVTGQVIYVDGGYTAA